MRRAICKVTPELICEKLQLPEGTQIDGATWDPIDRTVMLSVLHQDLPDVSPRHAAIFVAPRIVSTWV